MIAAVVVTYAAPAEMLARCLASIAAEPVDRIVLVDTGGRAQVPSALAGRVDLRRVENRGFGAAVNTGVRSVPEAQFVVFFNDDVVMQEHWLAPLVEAFDDPTVGAVQCVLTDETGERITSLGVQLDRYGAGTDVGDGDSYDGRLVDSDVAVFNGGAVAVRREFWDSTDGFDERYFLYYEDVDLARRGAALGWVYRLAGGSVGAHARSTSTRSLGDHVHFLRERNRLWAAARFESPATIVRALWLSIRRLRHEPHRVHARALLAGGAGMPIRWWERLSRR